MASSIGKLSPDEYAPLSYAQLRLWHLNQARPGSPVYNVKMALELKGKLRPDVLEQSIQAIADRHHSLRTWFSTSEGQPIQVVSPTVIVSLSQIDLQDMPEEQKERERTRLTSQFVQQRFDLDRKVLFGAALIRLAAQHHIVVVTFHHIICDGWSAGKFMNELGRFYVEMMGGSRSALPDLPVQYADFAAWQRGLAEEEDFKNQISYWKNKLAGAAPATYLPTDRVRADADQVSGARHSVVLRRETFDTLIKSSRQHGVTLFTMMLAALKVLMYNWTGQRDLVTGTVVANRDRPETEHLIGCFMEMLPIRLIVDGERSANEILLEIKEALIGAYSNKDCSFINILKATAGNETPGETPIYNVAILVQNFGRDYSFGEELNVIGVPIEVVASPQLDLRFIVKPRIADKRILLACEYKQELFDGETIQQLVESYCEVLKRFAEDSNRKVSAFALNEKLMSKAAGARQRDEPLSIRIAATFTAEPVQQSLSFWMDELDIPSSIQFTPYGQVFQQLLDKSSLLANNERGVNLLLVRLEDWKRQATGSELDSVDSRNLLLDNAERFAAALETAASRLSCPYLVCFCPASSASRGDIAEAENFEQLERRFVDRVAALDGVETVSSSELAHYYPVNTYYDTNGDEQSGIPYTEAFFASLGTMMARRLYGMRKEPYKAIVLDCDGTLWGGTVGEDGPLGLRFEPGHIALQTAMVEQHRAGMLICLCSRNNEADVLEVFHHWPNMPLKKEHILEWRINWKPKSENLKSLAEALHLGLESLIFIDDTPAEVAEVANGCPHVEVLQLPPEPSEIEDWLKHIWAFDHAKLTPEDRRRPLSYRENKQRDELRVTSPTYEDFLRELDLNVRITTPRRGQLKRVSELTYRSNQFNFAPIRRTEAELAKLCIAGRHECFVVEASDRFGDYGLVGVLMFLQQANLMLVDTFLLSCRALGKGIEHKMMERLFQIGMERGASAVEIQFFPTGRNTPAVEFIQSIGKDFVHNPGTGFVFNLPIDSAKSVLSYC